MVGAVKLIVFGQMQLKEVKICKLQLICFLRIVEESKVLEGKSAHFSQVSKERGTDQLLNK